MTRRADYPEDHPRAARYGEDRPDAAELAQDARERRTRAAQDAATGRTRRALCDDPWAPGSPYRTA